MAAMRFRNSESSFHFFPGAGRPVEDSAAVQRGQRGESAGADAVPGVVRQQTNERRPVGAAGAQGAVCPRR